MCNWRGFQIYKFYLKFKTRLGASALANWQAKISVSNNAFVPGSRSLLWHKHRDRETTEWVHCWGKKITHFNTADFSQWLLAENYLPLQVNP